ncbi:MAG: glycosyl hydrolase [bacterium]|nr:glycosyl hydrolase [bacterium]
MRKSIFFFMVFFLFLNVVFAEELFFFKSDGGSVDYRYSYPDITSDINIVEASEGGYMAEIRLDFSCYSGAAIGLSSCFSLSPRRDDYCLEFEARQTGSLGALFVSLVADEKEGKKAETTVMSTPVYGFIGKDWNKFSIPVADFPFTGKFWNGGYMENLAFDWNNIKEIKFSIAPQKEEREIKLFVKNVGFVKKSGGFAFVDGKVIDKDELSAKCLCGVFIEGLPESLEGIDEYMTLSGKKPAIISWYSDYSLPFNKEKALNVFKNDMIPLIIWESWYHDNRNAIKLDDIIKGRHDLYIEKFAEDIAKVDIPVWICWGHEFNGYWYPWSIAENEKDAKKFAAAYRHIVDIFRKKNAGNVKWIWTISYKIEYGKDDWNDIKAAYPGDDYVDFLGMTGYNGGADAVKGGKWLEFGEIFSRAYGELTSNFPDRDIFILEVASAETGGSKASWIRNMDSSLRDDFPAVKGFIWFNVKKERDWRINSSEEALLAFREISGKPYYKSNPDEYLKGFSGLCRFEEEKKSGPAPAKGKLSKYEPESGCYIGAALDWGEISQDKDAIDAADAFKKGIKSFKSIYGKKHVLFEQFIFFPHGADWQEKDLKGCYPEWDSDPAGWATAKDFCLAVIDSGGVPVLTLEPYVFGDFYKSWQDGNPAYENTKKFAGACGEIGHPVFIRFAHEMNGSWYPWGVWIDKNKNTVYDEGEETGHTQENYRTAFRNVSAMFKKYAPNAAVIWCPNHGWLGGERKDNYTGFYPGDEYVDWVGLDFYERGWNFPGVDSKIWGGLFTYGLTHDSLDDAATPGNESVNFYKVYCEEKQKPLMICETGATLTYRGDLEKKRRRDISHKWKGGKWNSGEYGWIAGVYATSQVKSGKFNYNIDTAFPKLKAVIWFHQAKREDVPVEINKFMEGEFSDVIGYGSKKVKWFNNAWCDYRIGNNSVDEETKYDVKYSSEDEIGLYRELTGVEYFTGEFTSIHKEEK